MLKSGDEIKRDNLTERLYTRHHSDSQSDVIPLTTDRHRRSTSVSASGDVSNQLNKPPKLLINQNKIIVAINEKRVPRLASPERSAVLASPPYAEFSDDEEIGERPHQSIHTDSNSVARKTKTSHSRAKTALFIIKVKRRFSDVLQQARINLWDARNETERRSIVGILLLFLLVPFIAPKVSHYGHIFSQQSRTVMLSVPEFLIGESDPLKLSLKFSQILSDQLVNPRPSQLENNDVLIKDVINLLISDPKFKELIKPESLQPLQKAIPFQIEKKFFNLMQNIRSELETKNRRTSSDIEQLKQDLYSRLDLALVSVPDLEQDLSALQHSSRRTSQMLETKLSKLYLDLETTRRDITKLRFSTSQSNEKSASTSRKTSKLEHQLEALVDQHQTISHEVQGCQTKVDSIDTVVTLKVHNLISKENARRNASLTEQLDALVVKLTSEFVDANKLGQELLDFDTSWRHSFDIEYLIDQEMKKNVEKKAEEIYMSALYRLSTEKYKNLTHSVGDVQKIISDALTIYDADKTGLVDYAQESFGGSVLGTPSTEAYNPTSAVISLWGIPVWWVRNKPSIILQPETKPGQCWAFTGTEGRVIIQLSNDIIISGVSLEHIPRSLSPDGNIFSAPKDFTVYGFTSLTDDKPAHLGNFTYQDNGVAVKTFHLDRELDRPYRLVQLHILSNHGNPVYTCIYRFRVHGKRSTPAQQYVDLSFL